MIQIALVGGKTKINDSTRGIGAHSSELYKALLRAKKKVNVTEEDLGTNLSKFDIIHFTVFRPFFLSLPFFKPKNSKFILTIHDLIPLVYPSIYKPGIRGKIKFMINKLLINKHVDAIITISETSKKDICRFLGVNPEIVNVVYIAPKSMIRKMSKKNAEKIIKRFKLPKSFALFDHGVNYNKNIPNLIKACEIASIPLAIVGKETENLDKLNYNHSELKHLKGIDFNKVRCLGYVTDEELSALYNMASVYIQPSLYEGFGMPVLEAVVVGTPIVVTKTQALVEILGDNVNYVNPLDPKDIAKGILNPNKLIKLPRVYSWEKTARETLDVYEKI